MMDEMYKKNGPVDQVRFNGDPKPIFGDLNKVFTKDKLYDLYEFEGQEIAFGDDDKPYKVTGNVLWTKLTEEGWGEFMEAVTEFVQNNPDDPYSIRYVAALYKAGYLNQ